MEFDKRYKSLNNEQKEAVDSIDGPVMVIAGPGTGKTELLSMRVANILKKTDSLPENILCLTFTDSGASAMRERLVEIIGKEAHKVAIHTFHSFGSEIINQNSDFFYNGAQLKPADKLSSYEVLQKILDNLNHSNPFSTKFNHEYTHINEILSSISDIKKSGFTSNELLQILDENQLTIEKAEQILAPIFEDRISKKTITTLEKQIDKIKNLKQEVIFETIAPLSRVLSDSLEKAFEEAVETGKTSPITAWKNSWLKKDENNKSILRSKERQAKLRYICDIYDKYIVKMKEAELFDFDDMILEVVHALEKYDDLKFNIQEKYQYILVDEFQDTNMAQMRILHSLADNEVNNGMPNIMIVGDDDQAIFSFQGADVSNILNFKTTYPKTKLITLKENYRSIEEILQKSRDLISQGKDRLEYVIDEVDKTLSANTKADGGALITETDTPSQERLWVVRQIKDQIDSGVNPSDIAVIARQHKYIDAILPYFEHFKIPVNYEKQDDALSSEIIILIEKIALILVNLAENNQDIANDLMPQILSHKALSIDPVKIWQLGIKAYENHFRWLEVMQDEPDFQPICNWFIQLSSMINDTPLEIMLDLIVGNPKTTDFKDLGFVSPIYEYYFSDKKLAENPSSYVDFLDALSAIRTKLRDYHTDQNLGLQAFVKFLDLSRKTHNKIGFGRHIISTDNAVQIMTAHKSKGLEFDNVYIINASDNIWGEKAKGGGNKITYPENLPIQQIGDSEDEKLRLFYVAMTRAKKRLSISYSKFDDGNKKLFPAYFLDSNEQEISVYKTESDNEIIESSELEWYERVTNLKDKNLKAILNSQLDKYKLSATHLNNFIDVTRGGPKSFLMNNLLHFPTAKDASADFGTAIHETLQYVHYLVSSKKGVAPIEDIVGYFESKLKQKHLLKNDLEFYLQKGGDILRVFLDKKYSTFSVNQKTELSFSGQNSVLDEVKLNGKLDVVDIDNKNKVIKITDYKTGKPASSWKGGNDGEKVKLHKYKQQLLFYKVLVENSRDYHSYNIESGCMQFVEHNKSKNIDELTVLYDNEDIEKFKKLIKIIWQHIINLDLPDTSNYDQTYKGILAFEQDLLEGKI